MYLLQLYLADGILHPGPKKLSCSIAGKEYYAGRFTSRLSLGHICFLGFAPFWFGALWEAVLTPSKGVCGVSLALKDLVSHITLGLVVL